MIFGYSKDISASNSGLRYEPQLEMEGSKCGAPARVKPEFDRLDLNRDGTVTPAELRALTAAKSGDLGVVLSALKTSRDARVAVTLLSFVPPIALGAMLSKTPNENSIVGFAGTLKQQGFVDLIQDFAQVNPQLFRDALTTMQPAARDRVRQAMPDLVPPESEFSRTAPQRNSIRIDGPGGEIRISPSSPSYGQFSRLVTLSKDRNNGADATLNTDQSIVVDLRGERFRITDTESPKQASAFKAFIDRIMSQ